jgi:hypothetical protein
MYVFRVHTNRKVVSTCPQNLVPMILSITHEIKLDFYALIKKNYLKKLIPKFSLTLQLFIYKYEKTKLTRMPKRERRHSIPIAKISF